LFASNDLLIDFLEKDFEGRDPEEYVLAKDSGVPWFENDTSYTNAFSKKLNKLGIFNRQPWHAFRHTGAIELFEITGDIYIVKTFLRHELIETTKRYLNSNRVNHVVEEKQNQLGKKFVKTVRNQERKKLIVINPNPKLLEVA
jgi:integrase